MVCYIIYVRIYIYGMVGMVWYGMVMVSIFMIIYIIFTSHTWEAKYKHQVHHQVRHPAPGMEVVRTEGKSSVVPQTVFGGKNPHVVSII